jgi:NADH dehydrogenase [ubiquinone] 1 alpha subcomplex assembly factor 1
MSLFLAPSDVDNVWHPAFNLEAVKGPAGPRALYSFCDDESVQSCVAMSDDLIGGSSTTRFDFVAQQSESTTLDSLSSSPSSYARFHGHISTALPDDKPVIKRSGYAAFRTPDQPATLLGRSVWDIDPYSFLALRIRSDGRSYLVNVQTEGVEPTDLHQHRLFAKCPGKWETVYVNWNDFVRTSYGFVVEPQTELLRQKVRSIGIGLTDRVEGPFELCIERIWATNDIEGEAAASVKESGNLKNRKGERIKW